MHSNHTCLSEYNESLEIMRAEYIQKDENLKRKMNYVIRKFNEFCKKECIDINLDLCDS